MSCIKFKVLYASIAAALALTIMAASTDALAGSSFSRSSSFSSSRSTFGSGIRSTPRPVINKTVVNRTTVVHAPQTSPAGGGFLSSMAGSFAGAGVAHWLFRDTTQPAPAAPVPQPQYVPIDCTQPQNKAVPVCQAPAVK